jgi:hypothetical protein
MAKKNKKKGFWVDVPKYSFLNTEIIEELELLFDMAPPSILKKSINNIFWAYICNTEQENYKPEMREISTDFNCILRFLEIAEMYEKNEEHKSKK